MEQAAESAAASLAGETGEATAENEQAQQGRWLDPTMTAEEVARAVIKEWEKREPARSRWAAKARRNDLWRKGVRGVRYLESFDKVEDIADVYVPRGASALAAPANFTDKLCRRVVATLTVDAPRPECEPATGSSEDREAAEFATRVLVAEGSESGFNAHAVLEESVDRGCTWGSDFLYVCVDPQGGGWRPTQVKAAPTAVSLEPDPLIDPTTGALTAEPVLKYVMEDGSLSDSPVGAKRRWLPKIRVEHLTPLHVVMMPEWSTGIAEAQGAILCIPTQLGELRAKYGDVLNTMSETDLHEAVNWRPKKWERLMPQHCKPVLPDVEPGKRVPDDTLCFPLYVYYRSCYEYPDGAYICILGAKHALHRGPWLSDMIQAAGEEEPEVLDIPLAQCRQLPDYAGGDPIGDGLAAKLGPLDEVLQNVFGYVLDWTYRSANPNVFLPVQSPLQPGALGRRDGTPLTYFPGTGNPVVYEQVPPIPDALLQVLTMGREMINSESGLEQTAQGVEAPSVKSGTHARTIIEQSLVSLSSIKRGAADCFVRLHRIVLQQMRAFYDGAQLLRYIDQDGEYKQVEWSRTDLGSTRDVNIARGTFTMMTPTAKNSFAIEMLQLSAQTGVPLLDATEARRVFTSNLNPILGTQDNPHLQRVRGQIKAWNEGPPEVIPPQAAQQAQQATEQASMAYSQQMAQMQAAAQAQGAPFQPPPPPQPVSPLTVLADQIWAPVAVDAEQAVAAVRHQEIGRFIATADYLTHPPEWRAALDKAYQAARQAAGVQTLEEQQQAASSAKQAEVQAKQEEANIKAQNDLKKEVVKAQVKAATTPPPSEPDRA